MDVSAWVPLAAGLFVALCVATAVFHVALAVGAPWGHLTMGGRWPGRLPPGARLASVAQAVALVLFARIVAGAGGLTTPFGPGWLVWLVVALTLVSAQLNMMTPSTAERRLWVPITALIAITGLVVAIWG